MQSTFFSTRSRAYLLLFAFCTTAVFSIPLFNALQVYAQEPTVLVTGYTGITINYTLTQLEVSTPRPN